MHESIAENINLLNTCTLREFQFLGRGWDGGIPPDFPSHAFQSFHSWQSSFLWKLWLKIYRTQGLEMKHWAQHSFMHILFDYLPSNSRSLMYISSQQPSMRANSRGRKQAGVSLASEVSNESRYGTAHHSCKFTNYSRLLLILWPSHYP